MAGKAGMKWKKSKKPSTPTPAAAAAKISPPSMEPKTNPAKPLPESTPDKVFSESLQKISSEYPEFDQKSASANAAAAVDGSRSPDFVTEFMPNISSGIQGVGFFLADQTNFSGWQIPKEEADPIAKQADRVLQLYCPGLAETDPKKLALCMLGGTIAMTFGGRWVQFMIAKKAAKRKAAADEAARARGQVPAA